MTKYDAQYNRLVVLRELATHLPLIIGRDGETGRICIYWNGDDAMDDPLFSGPETHARVYLAGFSKGYVNQPMSPQLTSDKGSGEGQ